MFESFTTHLSCLHRNTKNWLHHLTPKIRRRNSGFKSSDVGLVSSFAAMEVSNQLKQVFHVMDANGDGTITPLELSDVLLRLGCSTAVHDAHCMVTQVDCNGDGVIDLDEFMGVVSHDTEDDHLLDAFHIFDSDNDGLISPEELQTLLTNLGGTKCSIPECKKMIQGVDKNGDGFVDFTEFCLMMSM